ncbi:hypothetical protein LTR08_009022 [Meristemomyces frigidus]|nr:hypothetical protein LTR08_009022 [Meristemomyces frigidus]
MSTDEPDHNGTETTAITEPTTQASATAARKKRKRTAKNQTLTQFTIRDAQWTYIHAQQHTTSGPSTALDAVTAHLQLTAALSQFLGLHGAAIPMDILKLDGADVWVRVPADDKNAVTAAIGGWISGKGEAWRVKGTSSWDVRAMARDSGQDLFSD